MRFHPVPSSSGLGRHARQQAAGDKGWKEIEVPSGPLWSSPHSLPRPHSLKRQVLPEGSGPTARPQRCRASRAELVVPVTYHCVTNYPKLSDSKHAIFLYLMISQVRGSGQAGEGKSSAPHGSNGFTRGTG